MEERYALAEGKGRLTVRAAEGRVACEAMLPDDGRGLYKAYLSGPQGRFPLGALLPWGERLSCAARSLWANWSAGASGRHGGRSRTGVPGAAASGSPAGAAGLGTGRRSRGV